MSVKNKAANSPAATRRGYHGTLRQAIGRFVSMGNNCIYVIITITLEAQIHFIYSNDFSDLCFRIKQNFRLIRLPVSLG